MGNSSWCSTDRELRDELLHEATMIHDRRSALSQVTNQLHYIPDRFERFGSVFVKTDNTGNTPQFILQLNHVGSRQEIADISQKFYRSPSELVSEMAWHLELQTLIKDKHNPINSILFGKLNGVSRSIIVNSFNRFEDVRFKQILYNHYISRIVSGFQHINLHNTIDSFFLASGQERIEKDKVSVIVKEEVSASLAEINYHRKNNNWPWTQQQFELLIYHCLCGLDSMHNHNISHNDIRPENIYYSVNKHSYVIGGFHVASRHVSRQALSGDIHGVHYYLSPEAKKSLQEQVSMRSFNAFKNDVYSLGIALLESYYLATPANRDLLVMSGKKMQARSDILKLIGLMLQPQPMRPTTRDLLDMVVGRIAHRKISFNREETLIRSLRYKNSNTSQDIQGQRTLIAEAYENLFMAHKALQTNTDLLHFYQLRSDPIQQAYYHFKIAQSTPNLEEARESYQQSGRLYRSIASDFLREHRVDESINYYKRALEACYKQGADPMELAELLKELSRAYNQKSDYDFSKSLLLEALSLVEQRRGVNSLDYALVLVELGKIESQFQDYKAADNYLKAATKIIESRENETNTSLPMVRARILQALGCNLRLKAISNPAKQETYRLKAEMCLEQAIQLNSTIPQNYIHLASNYENLGHSYFDQRQFTKARKSYQSSLILRKRSSENPIESGQTLTFIANCNKMLKDYDKAILNYNEALEIFRKQMGNSHNQYTAVAIGNLGLVYRDKGIDSHTSQYDHMSREYLTTAKVILRDLYGENSPDYLYFESYQ